jgi:hypothetical protein
MNSSSGKKYFSLKSPLSTFAVILNIRLLTYFIISTVLSSSKLKIIVLSSYLSSEVVY